MQGLGVRHTGRALSAGAYSSGSSCIHISGCLCGIIVELLNIRSTFAAEAIEELWYPPLVSEVSKRGRFMFQLHRDVLVSNHGGADDPFGGVVVDLSGVGVRSRSHATVISRGGMCGYVHVQCAEQDMSWCWELVMLREFLVVLHQHMLMLFKYTSTRFS